MQLSTHCPAGNAEAMIDLGEQLGELRPEGGDVAVVNAVTPATAEAWLVVKNQTTRVTHSDSDAHLRSTLQIRCFCALPRRFLNHVRWFDSGRGHYGSAPLSQQRRRNPLPSARMFATANGRHA